jgi:hypothetical protein
MIKDNLYKSKLYRISKTGSILEYYITTDILPNGDVEVRKHHGVYQSPNQQVDIEVISSGKNLGKANETSRIEQSLITCNTTYNKYLDKGYIEYDGITPWKDFVKVIKNNLEMYLPPRAMLAKKDANLGKLKYPVLGQPKLDGIRCFAWRDPDTGKVLLFSRRGKYFDLSILKELAQDLEKVLPEEGIVLDGELYIHEAPDEASSSTINKIYPMPMQTIASAVKRRSELSSLIQFHVYDLAIPHVSQQDRIERLNRLKSSFKGTRIKLVKTKTLNNSEEVMAFFSKAMSKKYEGIMIRLLDAPYQFGFRSEYLQKYKEFETDEFEIVGVNEGSGRDEGTAVFVCKTHVGGLTFNAKPIGTWEERAEYWKNRESLIGKMVTVKYQGFTLEGRARFPNAIVIRDYE